MASRIVSCHLQMGSGTLQAFLLKSKMLYLSTLCDAADVKVVNSLLA